MTVATEVAYQERSWTGAETNFAPGMSAQEASHILVRYRNTLGVVSELTPGVHLAVSKAGAAGDAGVITAVPLNMPAAPGTVIFERLTPALQETRFEDLQDFPADIYTRLFDRCMLVAAEVRSLGARYVGTYSVHGGVTDFRPYQLAAADPSEDWHLATRGYVLQITGVLQLQQYVDQARGAAEDAQAALAATGDNLADTETARDLAQLWAEQQEDTPVGAGFSARHYAAKAAAAAAIITPLLSAIDYGFVSDAPTEARDYGSVA